jgi:hypothetical protein
MKEKWKDVHIEGFEDIYQISNKGRFKRKKHTALSRRGNRFGSYDVIETRAEVMMKARRSKKYPHKFVTIDRMVDDIRLRKTVYIHRMVAGAFVPNPYNLEKATVIDGNWDNLTSDNIRWISQSELSATAMKNHPENSQRIGKFQREKGSVTEELITKMRERRSQGMKYREIAVEFDVSVSTVYKYTS